MDLTVAGRWVFLVAGLVSVKLLFHAVYWPAFEGPDEPFHLGRARTVFAEQAGGVIDGELEACVASLPCGPDLSRVFGCPSFDRAEEAATFGVVTRSCPDAERGGAYPNYERHQPPAYYLLAASVLSATAAFGGETPLGQLLVLRLLSVALVAVAILGPLRSLAGDLGRRWYVGVLLALSIPGAAEALVRVANDAMVFAWASWVVWELRRLPGGWARPVLAGLGPLIKLTALPVVALAVATSAARREWRLAATTALAGSLFLPVQWFRGWAWGGTVELNSAGGGFDGTAAEALVGIVHSTATFLKTSLWLGGWSFVRPPSAWLLFVGIVIGALVLGTRWRRGALRTLGPDGIALVVAGLAVVTFFVSHRALFGRWGGVGGWYLWGWFPWLAVLVGDRVDRQSGPGSRWVTVLAVVGVLVANAFWFAAMNAFYT